MVVSARLTNPPLPRVVPGSFVHSKHNNLGPGKIVEGTSDFVRIEYFDSVASDRHVEWVPRDSVARFRIPSQTRAFFEEGGVWHVGRVAELLDDRYAIDLPNGELARLKEPDFFIRSRTCRLTPPLMACVAKRPARPTLPSSIIARAFSCQ